VSADATKTSELLAGVRLVIFDADGTLRETTVPGQPCPHAAGEWRLRPGVRDCLTNIDWSGRGIAIGVASNQDHVGYGLLSADAARELLRAMIDEATGGAMRNPDVRFCAHQLDEPCECRKPAPGMLLALMTAHAVSPSATLFIGDSPSDAEAARRAHVRFAWAREFFA